ncbi:DHA2 family efflux MFS transporter permease subunit [Phycicoccus flavus]|uniref:DHA2 family efflux MFS transporter permease subunit n=1 Tax=Phycicoccus flavus TaxID=2502783 RepID=UPI001F316F5D|nr:DHA2 family efflux MFS transporter permease subunit [Phycicoccus flavus]
MLAVVSVAQLMVVLDSSIVNIALPQAQQDLDIATLSTAQWVVTAYALAFGGLLLLGGRVADLFGRERAFLVGLVGFAAASGLGGAAPTASVLFAARALQGSFAALLAPAALSIIATTFVQRQERATALAVYGGVAGAGAAIGLLLGGFLTQWLNWRWCLYVNVPLALVTTVAGLRLLQQTRGVGSRAFDVVGAVLSSGGLAALVLGTTRAGQSGQGWGSTGVLGLLLVAVVLLAAFVARESRASSPLLPLRVVLDRNRGTAFLGVLFAGLGLFGMFLFLTFYFQQIRGYGPLACGLAFLPFSLGFLVSAGLASRLMPRLGPKPLILAGLPVAAGSLAVLCTLRVDSPLVVHVLLPEVGISMGMGLVFVALSSLALHGVGAEDAGVASALFNASQQVGGAIGTAVLSTIYAQAWTDWLETHGQDAIASPSGPQPPPMASVAGYHVAFAVAAGLLLVALVAVLLMVDATRESVETETPAAETVDPPPAPRTQDGGSRHEVGPTHDDARSVQ